MQKQKNKIIESLRINSKDVGSSEVQIGLLSDKINSLSNHFKKNKNDKHKSEKTFIKISQKKKSRIAYKNINQIKFKKIDV